MASSAKDSSLSDKDLDCYIYSSVLAFIWLAYLWESYLSRRQYKIYVNTTRVPAVLDGILDKATFTKARQYHIDKTNFGFWYGIYNQLLTTLILVFLAIPFMWGVCANTMLKMGYSSDHEILQSILFVLITSIITTFMDLPWNVYDTFIIEQKHGFNNQTYGFFVKDKVKKFVVNTAIMIPILAGLIYIIKIGGPHFYIYVWLFIVAVSLCLITIYPDYIAPLFDKYTPLPEGELRTKIEELAASIDFPLKKLYVVEGSKRSSHSNAYFFGFFKNKRIVLFDTLIEGYKPAGDKPDLPAVPASSAETDTTNSQTGTGTSSASAGSGDSSASNAAHKKQGCTTNEIVAVLAHELGHWSRNHVLKNFFISQVNMLLMFAAFGYLYQNQHLYSAFGFHDSMPVFIGLIIIFQFIFAPYNEFLGVLLTVLSRKFEFQADDFAVHLGKGKDLRSALIKLNKDNLSFPVYDWLYSAWHHSHPPLLDRLDNIQKQE